MSTTEQVLEKLRDVYRRARSIERDDEATDREQMIAGDVRRSSAAFAREMQEKQLTPTKQRDFERVALHLGGMLARIEDAMKGRAA